MTTNTNSSSSHRNNSNVHYTVSDSRPNQDDGLLVKIGVSGTNLLFTVNGNSPVKRKGEKQAQLVPIICIDDDDMEDSTDSPKKRQAIIIPNEHLNAPVKAGPSKLQTQRANEVLLRRQSSYSYDEDIAVSLSMTDVEIEADRIFAQQLQRNSQAMRNNQVNVNNMVDSEDDSDTSNDAEEYNENDFGPDIEKPSEPNYWDMYNKTVENNNNNSSISNTSQSNNNNNQLKSKSDCIVCFGPDKNHIMVPCGHLCLCGKCASFYAGVFKEKKCPYCATPFTSIVKVIDTQ